MPVRKQTKWHHRVRTEKEEVKKRGSQILKSSGNANQMEDVASSETMLYILSANVAIHTSLFFLLLICLTVGTYLQFSWQVSGYLLLF